MPSSLLAFPWAEVWPAARSSQRPAAPAAGSLWRYVECPEPVSLSEGGTPLLAVAKPANLLIKEEGRNPHGSFQDRVASLVLTAAKAAGWQRIGYFGDNAALASTLASYAAYAGIEAEVTLDPAATEMDSLRCIAMGADLRPTGDSSGMKNALTPADLAQAARLAARTVAFEIAEQLLTEQKEESPVTLLLPSASPQEVRDYEEAFACLRDQGRISALPQCAAVSLPTAETSAQADSGIQITAEQLRLSLGQLARSGLLLSPEGAAAAAAYEQRFAAQDGKTVVLNPRSALVSALEISSLLGLRRHLRHYPGRMPVGGIICPQ